MIFYLPGVYKQVITSPAICTRPGYIDKVRAFTALRFYAPMVPSLKSAGNFNLLRISVICDITEQIFKIF